MRDTVEAWEDAARRPTAQRSIHPTGDDAAAYAASGQATALRLAERIGPDGHLLIVDFGAGDGRVTIPLELLYPRHVLAVDASPTMLERLRARAPHIETLVDDGTTLYKSVEAEVIVALAVLIHHRHADTARILAGLARALRPGGRLLIDLALYEESREPTGWADIATWTALELEDAAVAAGLTLSNAPTSPGAFSWATGPGPHHGELLELRK